MALIEPGRSRTQGLAGQPESAVARVPHRQQFSALKDPVHPFHFGLGQASFQIMGGKGGGGRETVTPDLTGKKHGAPSAAFSPE